MSNTETSTRTAPEKSQAAGADMKLEVVVLPVSGVERAKSFYTSLGWRVDADFSTGDKWRVVQVTPPGSACSFFIGRGLTKATPGSAQGLLLMVDDVEKARAELIGYGVDVSGVFHFDGGLHFTGTHGRVPGPDPERRSYYTFASFNDPDGNGWVLQEIKTRLPGRGLSSMDVVTLTGFLQEAERHHGEYEPTATKHHWSGWYAAYVVALQRGRSNEEAATDAALHTERT